MGTMKVTTKSLRTRAKEILECVERGEPVTITYRGRPRARLVNIDQEISTSRKGELPVFGIWADRDDLENVEAHIDRIRKGRFNAD